MKKILILLITGVTIFLGVYFWIELGPHDVTFANPETDEPYANSEIEVIYAKFCVSSPCTNKHQPHNIYSGTTNASGTITLWGHSAKEIGQGYQFGRMIGYTIYINEEKFNYMDKEHSTNKIIYLISDEMR